VYKENEDNNDAKMVNKISTPVSVLMAYDSKTGRVYPRCLTWKNRVYPVSKVGFHHSYYEGRTLYHVFSVASKTLFFRLILNTENLHWILDETFDNSL
jgi:hypothetical protein